MFHTALKPIIEHLPYINKLISIPFYQYSAQHRLLHTPSETGQYPDIILAYELVVLNLVKGGLLIADNRH